MPVGESSEAYNLGDGGVACRIKSGAVVQAPRLPEKII